MNNELTTEEVYNTHRSIVPLVMKFLRNEPLEDREIMFVVTRIQPTMLLAIAIANGIRSVRID